MVLGKMNLYKNKKLGIVFNLDNMIRIEFDDSEFIIYLHAVDGSKWDLDLTEEEYKDLKEKSFRKKRGNN